MPIPELYVYMCEWVGASITDPAPVSHHHLRENVDCTGSGICEYPVEVQQAVVVVVGSSVK
jgi:hypothetical protein